ncbi:tetratricopeptide repeat protein [Candidatus Thiothrix anitrata]|uniref:Tetratricopeptide repeat protein n=1 Tax=Candidatus Thiothrix anitrata TaxID=2823902 RepID=A0ABX7X574_9GAMM|nr:tetratricopeptide repeat protein [Candidatus Thiothrix anitrata]QTR50432.1 tetratricopeptide repeat protein [Candidatus Thiothrix anitrata]
MRRLVFVVMLLLAACGDKQEVSQNSGGDFSPNQVAGRDAIQNVTVNNYQKSQDYQDLLAKRDDARENVQEYPKNAKFRQVLTTAEQNLENFKRDVLKLADEINKFPVNTERLKQAVALFNAQQYAEARKVLDAGEITQEQDALLEKQQRLQEEQATITAQLDDKANEWLLKAQLTAIAYSLGDQRIAQTSGYFEKALKSGRTPKRLFTYAKFLQDNNEYRAAETLYTETLSILRELAKDNPAVYQSYVAMTLNNLGILVAADSQRRKEAETIYTEALTLRRQLAKDNPAVYQPDVAMTLNNLGILVADGSQRRKEAETLYTEALTLRRELAKDNPAVYLSDVAMTLNNLGALVYVDSQRRKEAETLYTEALSSYRGLAKDNSTVYLPYVAMMLNNLGILVSDDSQRRKEAEILYTEALTLRRELTNDNPAVYLLNVANTLMVFGGSYLDWNEPTQALPLLQESAQLFAPLAQQAPVYLGKNMTLCYN